MTLLRGGLAVQETVTLKKDFKIKKAYHKYSRIKIQQISKIIYFRFKTEKLLKKKK
jgi:hypothetical protein